MSGTPYTVHIFLPSLMWFSPPLTTTMKIIMMIQTHGYIEPTVHLLFTYFTPPLNYCQPILQLQYLLNVAVKTDGFTCSASTTNSRCYMILLCI